MKAAARAIFHLLQRLATTGVSDLYQWNKYIVKKKGDEDKDNYKLQGFLMLGFLHHMLFTI